MGEHVGLPLRSRCPVRAHRRNDERFRPAATQRRNDGGHEFAQPRDTATPNGDGHASARHRNAREGIVDGARDIP